MGRFSTWTWNPNHFLSATRLQVEVDRRVSVSDLGAADASSARQVSPTVEESEEVNC